MSRGKLGARLCPKMCPQGPKINPKLPHARQEKTRWQIHDLPAGLKPQECEASALPCNACVNRDPGAASGGPALPPLTGGPEPAPQEEMVLDRQNAHDTFGRHAEGLAHFLGPNDPPEMNHPVVHDNTQRR